LSAACLLVLAASCETLNIGGPYPTFGPQVTLQTPAAGSMFGLGTGTFTASWFGGTAPYTIAWDFGGAATNVPAAAATSPSSQTVTFVDLAAEGTFTVTVTVTDNNGVSGTASATITVGATQNQAPTITVSVAGSTVTATVSDADGDDVTVTPSNFGGGVSTSTTPVTVTGGNGDAVFNFSADDFFAGATSGTATFTADDGSATATADASGISAPGVDVPNDTLVAVPLAGSASVGDEVKFVFATGDLPNDFRLATGVSPTFPTGSAYVTSTFDFGTPAPGDPAINGTATADQSTVDGIWTLVGASPGPVPDAFLPEFTSTGGETYFTFPLVPFGGSNVAANTDIAGANQALFNIRVEFTAAGTYTLGFLEQDGGSNLTFYQSDATVRYWNDITNAGGGSVDTSIDVS
jgi:hypothetical protein